MAFHLVAILAFTGVLKPPPPLFTRTSAPDPQASVEIDPVAPVAMDASPLHLVLARYGHVVVQDTSGGLITGMAGEHAVSLQRAAGGAITGFVGEDAARLFEDSSGRLSGYLGEAYVSIDRFDAGALGYVDGERMELLDGREGAAAAAFIGDDGVNLRVGEARPLEDGGEN